MIVDHINLPLKRLVLDVIDIASWGSNTIGTVPMSHVLTPPPPPGRRPKDFCIIIIITITIIRRTPLNDTKTDQN